MPLNDFHCPKHETWDSSCRMCQEILQDMKPENYAPQDIIEGDVLIITLEHARGSLKLNCDLGQGHISVSQNIETQKDWVTVQETCQRAIANMIDVLKNRIIVRDMRQIERHLGDQGKEN